MDYLENQLKNTFNSQPTASQTSQPVISPTPTNTASNAGNNNSGAMVEENQPRMTNNWSLNVYFYEIETHL
jgi:hypothetical protein